MIILAHTDGYSISLEKFEDIEAAQKEMTERYEAAKEDCPCENPLEDECGEYSAKYADYNIYLVWEIQEL